MTIDHEGRAWVFDVEIQDPGAFEVCHECDQWGYAFVRFPAGVFIEEGRSRPRDFPVMICLSCVAEAVDDDRIPTPKTNAPAKGDTKTGAGFEGMSSGTSENPAYKEDNNP